MTDDVKAAREEQREACARAVEAIQASERSWHNGEHSIGRYDGVDAAIDAVRATPLTATPLGDEIRALRERAEKAEAERDAFAERLRRSEAPVPGLAESGPYTLADVDAIEAFRGKPYERLRATVEQAEKKK